MLGSEPLPALELNKKRSRSGSVKIMRRDSRSIKIVRTLVFNTYPFTIYTLVNTHSVLAKKVLDKLFSI